MDAPSHLAKLGTLMPFPQTERFEYSVNPLVRVECTLEFPKNLELEAKLPAGFQRRVQKDFPEYEEVTPNMASGTSDVMKQFLAAMTSAPHLKVQHRFLTADGFGSVTLASTSLAFRSTNYTSWPAFSSQLWAVLDAFQEEYEIPYFKGAKLRYLNFIPKNGFEPPIQSMTELINPELSGPLTHDTLGTAITKYAGELNIDLTCQGNMTLKYGYAGTDTNVFVIDSTCAVGGLNLDRNQVRGLLVDFNKQSGRLFRWATTDALREALSNYVEGE